MNAWLVLQEGPGAGGTTYSLDPYGKAQVSIGRSSECDVTLRDGRASRHHADIRWNGRQWMVVDLGSTNGTYVNGLRVHGSHDLRFGDRVTIGETTLVLRDQPPSSMRVEQSAPQGRPGREPAQMAGRGALRVPPPAVRPQPARRQPLAGPARPKETSTASSVVFWLVQGGVVVAVVLLASGAFLPWLRVTGKLSQDLGSVLETVTDVVSYFLGSDSYFEFTQEISGLEGYGKLTLGLAVISALTMIVDLFFFRKTVVPGIVYLLSSLIVAGAMFFDLTNFYRLYKQASSWSMLFGIQLADVIQVFDHFIDMQVTPLIGLPMTIVGLVLLFLGGIGRLAVALLDRNR